MSTINFPYNQTISGITVQSADATSPSTYDGYSFIVAAYSDGLSVGQIQPNTTDNGYNASIPYGIDTNGSSNTAMAFLQNPNNSASPIYFLVGSTGKDIQLYSITPTAPGTALTAGGVSSGKTVDSFDEVVSSILYVSSLSTLYVAGSLGNLYTYTVAWSTAGVPSFSYVGSNTSYSSPTGTIVSLYYANNSLFVTGLNINDSASSNGAYQFTDLTAGAVLGSGSLLANSADSVAMAFTTPDANGPFYLATFTSLACYTPQTTGGYAITPIAIPSGQSICSLAWSANTANIAAAGQTTIPFPEGCLMIGTFTTTGGEGNNLGGSLYTYDPSTPQTAPIGWVEGATLGTPYSLLADQNLNLFVNSGWTGLTLYSYTTEPATIALVDNVNQVVAAAENTAWNAIQKLAFRLEQQAKAEIESKV